LLKLTAGGHKTSRDLSATAELLVTVIGPTVQLADILSPQINVKNGR